jgi:ATP-binding cassette, subfamily C, bacterial CydCD
MLALAIFLGVLGAGVTVMQMAFLSKIVNQVFWVHQRLSQLVLLILLLLGSIIVHAGLVWLRGVVAQHGAIRVKSELRERLFAHLLRLGPAYCNRERTGELVTTANEGIERLDAYISRYLPQIFLSVLIPLLICIVIFPFDWMSATLLLVTGPVIPLLMILVGSYAEQHIQRQWLALSRMSAHFLDVIQGLPTLKLFNRSSAEHSRIARTSDLFRAQTLKSLRLAFLSGMILEFMTCIAIGLVAVVLGVRLLDGGISFASAFFVLLLAPEFYRPLRELGIHRHAGMEGKAAAKRLSEILATPLPLHEGSTPSLRPTGQLEITLQHLTYTYPGNDHPALNDVSLVLPACTCTALVGRSGAGKSTFVNILLRFIDAQSGEITVNGIPLASFPPALWREYVALVPQKPYLFHDSVSANIRLANPQASDQEVEYAAELAGAAQFISRLPQGYATQIGERGMRLSAGQAQRIAIARAFLKNAPLLILDEPTSSLDPESETLIRQALERLLRDRTVLVIAHRQNTIACAQQVAVLHHGALVEVGLPATLHNVPGSYAQLMGEPSGRGRGQRSGLAGALEAAHVEERNRQLITGSLKGPSTPTPPPPAPTERDSERERLQTHTEWDSGRGIYRRLLSFLSPFRWQIALAILLGSATIASNIALLGMAAYLIAAAAITPFLVLLTLPIYIVRFMGVSRATARYAERLLSHDVTFRLLADLRVWSYEHLEPLLPAQLLTYRSGDVLTRLVSDIDDLQNVYLGLVSPIIVALVIAVSTFWLFTIFSPLLAWVAVAFLAVTGLGIPGLAELLSRGLGPQQLAVRAELNTQIADGVQGVQDLLAYGRTTDQSQKVADLDRLLERIQRRMAFITGLQQALNDLLMNLALWTILILAILLVTAKSIDAVYLGFLALVILASFEAVQPLAQAFQFLGHSKAAATRVFALAETKPLVMEPASPLPAPLKQSSTGYSLEFDHVHFSYVTDEDEVINDVSFRLCPGSRVAIVGPSGSGKSTLVRLALRFWDPACGVIRLDGQDIRLFSLTDLRATMGVVAQDTYLFNDTLRNNLLLARSDASAAQLEQVIEQAQLAEFVCHLPEGLDTWIGEQGLCLSGGERQRLAIARALLKDAPLLILDEATANLDPTTEQALLDALDSLMQGRTTLIITHRLVAMERMDEILVLDHGHLKEHGTHAQLLATGGLYRQMFDMQNSMLSFS